MTNPAYIVQVLRVNNRPDPHFKMLHQVVEKSPLEEQKKTSLINKKGILRARPYENWLKTSKNIIMGSYGNWIENSKRILGSYLGKLSFPSTVPQRVENLYLSQNLFQ